MQTYILKVVPSEFPNCVRVFEIAAEQSLLSLHEAIAGEFKLKCEEPHAFFMSGDFLDASTAFAGTTEGGGVTGIVKLSSLELAKGLQFGYAPDYQQEDGLYIEVADLGEAAKDETYPRVVSREGDLPDPEELMSGGHGCGCGCGEDHDDCDDCEGCEDDCEGCESAQGDDESAEGCGCGDACECSDESEGECGCGDACGCSDESEGECGDDCGCDEDHHEDCTCESCEGLRKALAGFDRDQLERLGKAIEVSLTEEKPDNEVLLAGIEAVVALCPTAEKLGQLGEAMNLPVEDWAGSMLSAMREELPAERLLGVSEAFLKVTGAAPEKMTHARLLADSGKPAEALKLIETVEATNPFERDVLVIERARVQMLIGETEKPEAALRGLLDRRWLSGTLREECIELLDKLVRQAGREDEFDALIDREEALLDKNEALRRGVVKNGPKVAPNDKCPCGSGLKFKKCCGLAA